MYIKTFGFRIFLLILISNLIFNGCSSELNNKTSVVVYDSASIHIENGVGSFYFGKSNLSPTIDAANADVKLIGEDAEDRFGESGAGGR